MNDNKNSVTVNGSFCGALFIVFLVLKLIGVISWSWWLVFAPLWVPPIIAIFILFIINIFF